MKPLKHLAQELVVINQNELRRIRRMNEAEFAMLRALHAAAAFDIDHTIDELRKRG